MSIWPKETTNLTQYLIINDLRPFSRTPVTFEIIDIVMCYLTQAEVKKISNRFRPVAKKHVKLIRNFAIQFFQRAAGLHKDNKNRKKHYQDLGIV